MALPINQVKMPTPKFKVRQKISHSTGLDCFVSEVHTTLHSRLPNGTIESSPLDECLYIVSYLDNNGQLHQFKALESEFSE